MRMSRLALLAGIFGATYAPPTYMVEMQPTPKAVHSARARSSAYRSWKNPGTGRSGNKGLPRDVQIAIIIAAKAKRQAKAIHRIIAASKRDEGYYRVSQDSNKNRFYLTIMCGDL